MRRTRSLRIAIFFAAALRLVAGARAAAQAPAAQSSAAHDSAARDVEPGGWRASASYGQASAPRSQGFAEQRALSILRDFPLGGRFTLGVEATPLFVVNLTRVDLPGRPRETAYAVAATPLLAWTYRTRSAMALRVEAGVGVFGGFSPIPAEGSRFNFLDAFAVLFLVRVNKTRELSFGVRRVHVSNLGLVGPDNPGLSFYAAAAGISWPSR